jgi:hypothetical protein
MSHYAVTLRDKGAKKLISSSGGNAGLACTAAGVSLGLEVEVIVPTTTGDIIKSKIQSLASTHHLGIFQQLFLYLSFSLTLALRFLKYEVELFPKSFKKLRQ